MPDGGCASATKAWITNGTASTIANRMDKRFITSERKGCQHWTSKLTRTHSIRRVCPHRNRFVTIIKATAQNLHANACKTQDGRPGIRNCYFVAGCPIVRVTGLPS